MFRGHTLYYIPFLLCCLQMLQCRPETNNLKGRESKQFKLRNVLLSQSNPSDSIKSFVHDMKETLMSKLYKEKKRFKNIFDISPRTGNSNDKNKKRNQSVLNHKLHKNIHSEKKLDLNGRSVSQLNKNFQQEIKNTQHKNPMNRTQNSSSNLINKTREMEAEILAAENAQGKGSLSLQVPFFNLNNIFWPFKNKYQNACTDDLYEKLRLETEEKLLCGSNSFCINRGNKIIFGPTSQEDDVYISKAICYGMGAKIFIPKTKDDFEFMLTEFNRVNDFYDLYDLWLPIFLEDSGKLVWFDGEDVVGGPYYEPDIDFDMLGNECFYLDADGPLDQSASESECNDDEATLLCEIEVKCP